MEGWCGNGNGNGNEEVEIDEVMDVVKYFTLVCRDMLRAREKPRSMSIIIITRTQQYEQLQLRYFCLILWFQYDGVQVAMIA